MLKARENAGDQVMIGFSFASDWLTKWREYSGPITERSKAKPRQSQITFDNENCSLVRSTLPIGPSSLSSSGWSRTWRYIGRRNANVLPPPVLAIPKRRSKVNQ